MNGVKDDTARVVTYADDFVILSRDDATEALAQFGGG